MASSLFSSLGQEDFNGDGELDLITQTKTVGGSMVHLILTTNKTDILDEVLVMTLLDKKIKVIGAGYYDEDEFLDILLQNGKEISFVAMSNTMAISVVSLGTLNKRGQLKASGDLDGDGISDIFLQNGSGIQLLDGLDLAALTDFTPLKSGYKVVGVGDADGDGLIDFLLQNEKNISLAYFIDEDEFSVFDQKEPDFTNLKIEIIPFYRLNQSLGKVVAVQDTMIDGVNLVFQKKNQAFRVDAGSGDAVLLPIQGLGAKKKIVGPH